MSESWLSKIAAYSLLIYMVGSMISMAPMNISFLLVLLVSAYAFFQSLKKRKPISLDSNERSYLIWGLALLVTCWGSLFVAAIWPSIYADHAPEVTIHGFLKIWYLIIPAILLAVYTVAVESKNIFSLECMIKPWWTTTLFLFVVAIIQYFVGWPKSELIPDQTLRYHANLFYGHHLSTSSILIFPAFTALAVAFGYFTRRKKFIGLGAPTQTRIGSFHPYYVLAVGIAGTLILFLSYARTAWIALLIGFALLIKKYIFARFTRRQWMSSVVAIIVALGALSQTSMIKERIVKNYGVSERFRLWKANIDFFETRPLTGIGWLKTQEMSEFYFKKIDPENYRGYFWGHAHSNFFEMLGGTGLLGLFAFFGWSLFTLRFAHQLAARFEVRALSHADFSHENSAQDFFYSDFARGIFIALILLHFNGLTNVTFWEGKVMHQQMLAVGMLLILNKIYLSKAQT